MSLLIGKSHVETLARSLGALSSASIFSQFDRTIHVTNARNEKIPIPDDADAQKVALTKLYRLERVTPAKRGVELLKTPAINKGMAFSLWERQYLGIHGLLPPAFLTEEQQVHRTVTKLRELPSDLERYMQLDALQDRNEKLFYRVLNDNIKEMMPIVYTPNVGLACQKYGYIYRAPKGIYVTINDNSISKIYQILCNWPYDDVRAIVVTDGERILGLGDLGAHGIGIPIGKLILYVALAGIQPRWCLPVIIDVGTDNQALLNDQFYLGLKQKRVRDERYVNLMDNFMKACVKKYGQKVLIQFEDFIGANAYRFLDRYQNQYCMFNDDIQGTASVAVAGLLACTRLTKKKMSQEKFLFYGAGGASIGIAELCVMQMQSEGLSFEEACARIFMFNSRGLMTKTMANLSDRQKCFTKDMPNTTSLVDVVNAVKPGAILGISTIKGSFSSEVIKAMAKYNDRPIIFALSNPTSKAECTAEEAYRLTNGSVLFASGSPFENVEVNGKTYEPSQGNNAYIFPGVALGVILFQVRHIDNSLFLLAARKVAENVTEECLAGGRMYPRLHEIREMSIHVAVAIGEYCYANGMAQLYPKPAEMETFVRSQIYSVDYDDVINQTYDWPEQKSA